MEKRQIRSVLAFIMAVTLSAGMLSGCGSSQSSSSAGSTASTAMSGESTGLDEGGVTNATGLPITSEPITLTAVVKANTLMPDMVDTNVWKTIADATNITIDLNALQDTDKIDLMFASGDFPDLVMRTDASANQISTAVDSGYFTELEPLLEQYAPTWYQFMQDNPLIYNSSLATDGKLYSLPYIDFDPTARNLRDQFIIMKGWLDELGLSVPTTTEEFKNALIAIKDNAGKGSIPSDVIPYYFYYDSYIGGQFDIYGSFGVYITSSDYLYVKDGVVTDQSTNPDLKEPLKYLNELYELGLIPPEVFTDDWNNYVAKITSDPPIVGAYSSYANRQMDIGTSMKALDSGNGSTPLMRSQAYSAAPTNVAIISKSNKYPVATTRLFEELVSDEELMMTIGRGTKGVVWDYDSNNKAYMLFWETDQDKWNENSKDIGLQNSFVGLFDSDFYKNRYKDVDEDTVNSRSWAYYNVYDDCTMPNDMVYVSGSLDEDDTNMMNQYATDLGSYRKTMFADFITGKQNIDATWDTYVAKMKELGLDDFIALKQKAYDVVMK